MLFSSSKQNLGRHLGTILLETCEIEKITSIYEIASTYLFQINLYWQKSSMISRSAALDDVSAAQQAEVSGMATTMLQSSE